MRIRKPRPRPCPHCQEPVLREKGIILPHLQKVGTTRMGRVMCPLGGKRAPRRRREVARQEWLL